METPLSVLCKKYGVSDNAARKKCKSINIPLPTNAYWGQLRAGKKPAIPELDEHTQISVTFNPIHNISEPKQAKEKENLFDYIEEGKRVAILKVYEKLEVNKGLVNLHPLITKHEKQFQKLKQNKKIDLNNLNDIQRSYEFKTDYPIVDTSSVTERQMNRAYSVLDTIFKALEQCGCKIKVESNFNSTVIINDFELRFRIREKYLKSESTEKSKYDWMYNRYVYTPSGTLGFIIYEGSYSEHAIYETDKKTLDTKINDIFKKFFDLAEKMKQYKLEREEWNRNYEENRRKEDELRKHKEQEKQKIVNLIKDSENFVQARTLREYVAAKKNFEEPSEELDAWLKWANSIADWIDPLTDKKHKFLQGSFEENKQK